MSRIWIWKKRDSGSEHCCHTTESEEKGSEHCCHTTESEEKGSEHCCHASESEKGSEHCYHTTESEEKGSEYCCHTTESEDKGSEHCCHTAESEEKGSKHCCHTTESDEKGSEKQLPNIPAIVYFTVNNRREEMLELLSVSCTPLTSLLASSSLCATVSESSFYFWKRHLINILKPDKSRQNTGGQTKNLKFKKNQLIK